MPPQCSDHRRSGGTLSPSGPDRFASTFDSMPPRLPIDADSRRVVAEASPKLPAPVDRSACTYWCICRLMRSPGHPSAKKGPSSATSGCSRMCSSIQSPTLSARAHASLEREADVHPRLQVAHFLWPSTLSRQASPPVRLACAPGGMPGAQRLLLDHVLGLRMHESIGANGDADDHGPPRW